MEFPQRTIIKYKDRVVFDTSPIFFVEVTLKMFRKPFRKPFLRFLRYVRKDYFAEEYSSVAAYDVSLPIDEKIPFSASAETTYLSFESYPLAIFDFIHYEFHGLADAEIFQALDEAVVLYENTAKIYESFQTYFSLRKQTGRSLAFLHLIDKNKNCFPSLHAQIVGKAYLLLKTTIATYGKSDEVYADLLRQMFEHAVHILEACFVSKQHSVRDIAAGFALLTYLDKGFTSNLAKKFIETIFTQDGYGFSGATEKSIREVMGAVYEKFLQEAQLNKSSELPFVAFQTLQK